MENKIKTLEEALKESRESKRIFIKEQKEIQKKKEKQNLIIVSFIGISIFIFMTLCLFSLNNSDIENCVKAGNSTEICERNM